MNAPVYFFDTSALFKRYVDEAGSAMINQLFTSGADCFISLATLTEVIANLRRLVDVDGLLTEEEFSLVKGTFLGEIGNSTIQTVDITPSIILSSLEICSQKYTTPLDSIQLASALSLNEGVVFVCSDKKLLQMAAQWGLNTLNPEE